MSKLFSRSLARRHFITSSLRYGISILGVSQLMGGIRLGVAKAADGLDYTLKLDVVDRLFDGKQCWVHPRVGIIPGAGREGLPLGVMTMNILDLSGSDVFKGVFGLHTDDGGTTWTKPYELANLNPRHETIAGVERPVALSDYWPTYHQHSGKLLGIGHTVVYTPEWKVTSPRPRHTAFAVYDAASKKWSDWAKLDMPDKTRFFSAGAGCVQRYDEADGTILLPIYFSPPGENSKVIVARCAFDGSTLTYLEHGNELRIDDDTRGLHEPSLTRYNGKYFLTIRNDRQGFVTQSTDGIHYEEIRAWKFDDGTDLGNYNTQQHWVTHNDGLFLVYTRRGADNDRVVRHRAPLFMAAVDPERLCVIRDTERILVPDRGAGLGNFGVTDVGPNETWVTVSEWMQPLGVEKYGSDGSVFVARILWDQPNKLVV